MTTPKQSRRKFLAHTGLVLGASFAGHAALAQAKKADAAKDAKDAKEAKAKKEGAGAPGAAGDLPLVDEKSPLAVTLKYSPDASRVPAGIKVAKGGVEGSQQHCGTCMFYTKAGKHGADEAGKCQLFTQGNVPSKGWCSSWTKKA